MKEYTRKGITTTQYGMMDLVVQEFYKGKVDGEFVKIFYGAKWWNTRKRKMYCIRLATSIGILMMKEMTLALIERNCVFVFPVGNIKMSIRDVSKKKSIKQYVPVIDCIRLPFAWQKSFDKMFRKGKFLFVRFGPEFYKNFRNQIDNGKRYREKYEVNGF